MRTIVLSVMAACAVAMLSGCETSTVDQPLLDPFIRGTVTAIDGSAIRIEENPAEEFRGKKALLRITGETVIIDSSGEIASQGALAVGQFVSAWVTGPVSESYPVQARASVIVIEPMAVPL